MDYPSTNEQPLAHNSGDPLMATKPVIPSNTGQKPNYNDSPRVNNSYLEGNKMTDSSLNATEIAVGSLLAGNRGGHGGGGAWGGGYSGYGPFASPGANAVRLDRNAQLGENQADCTREVLGKQMDDTRTAFSAAEIARNFQRVCDSLNTAEFRTSDRLRDIEREMNANARVAAECCCETQKEILKLDAANNLRFAEISKDVAVNQGDTNARLASIDAKIDANQKFNELFAENQALKTQVACGCTTGCSNPCS